MCKSVDARVPGVPVFELTDKVAIVTGAASGIGKGVAWAYAGYDCKLVLVDLNEEPLNAVAKEIEDQFGKRPLVFAGDLRDGDFIDSFVQGTVDQWGRIDVLVNCAGVGITRLAVKCSEEEYDRVMDTNLKAVFFICQKVAKVMIEQEKGNIINLASVTARVAGSHLTPYMAAKAGVLQMTRGMALEWARYNIRVNCICPHYIRTGMTEAALNNEKFMNDVARVTPHKRTLGEPEDIAAAAVFLASDASDLITGLPMYVDGGRSIW